MSDNKRIQADWQLTCNSARSHAASIAASCRREAAALINRQAAEFCDRAPPATDTDLLRRRRQATYLTSRISTIAHADLMARNHPGVDDEILAETKAFLGRLDLDDSPFSESMALTSKISALCHSDLMART